MIQACLLERFKGHEIPPFPCPTCGGSLVTREKGAVFDQSRESREEYELTRCSALEEGTFALRLVCPHSACKEGVICIGKYSVEQDEYPNGEPFMAQLLTPLFFYPAIYLFSLPKPFPERIKKPLLESFSLYWSNPSASGNALRIALEALIDHQGVNKWEKSASGKRFMRKLHARVVEFATQKPDIGEKLLALKWLGNSGSHFSGLKQKDVVTGFELFEYVIDELFVRKRHRLAKTAKRIIRRKGPV